MCDWNRIISDNKNEILERARLVYLTSLDIRHCTSIVSWTISIDQANYITNLANKLNHRVSVKPRSFGYVCDIITMERSNIINNKLANDFEDNSKLFG